jgi:hypothetical protein
MQASRPIKKPASTSAREELGPAVVEDQTEGSIQSDEEGPGGTHSHSLPLAASLPSACCRVLRLAEASLGLMLSGALPSAPAALHLQYFTQTFRSVLRTQALRVVSHAGIL